MEELREAIVSHLLKHMRVIVVSVTYIHRLTLNRSHTYVSGCAVECVYDVKPWEKFNALGLQLDVMV